MSDKKDIFGRLGDWIGRINNSVTGVSALLLTSVGIFYMAWEFSDRWQERTFAQTEYSKHQDNLQQAYFLRQILKKDLDSLTATFSKTNHILLEQSIKKDSILLLILPEMSREISTTKKEVDLLNHKFNNILSSKTDNDKVDIVRMFNQRDSIAHVKHRNDSLNVIILREIRRANNQLMLIDLPQYGDFNND